MDEIDEKSLDKQISEYIQSENLEALNELVKSLDNDVNNKMKQLDRVISFDEKILILRDIKVLNLKKFEIGRARKSDLQLSEEFSIYNEEIDENNSVTVVKSEGKDGENIELYYYRYATDDVGISRQLRTVNKEGTIHTLSRNAILSDGECCHIDDAMLVYSLDKFGNKKAGLYQDGITGMHYYEYDKDGKISMMAEKEYVEQRVEEDGKTYCIYDGYFKPSDNNSSMTYKGLPNDTAAMLTTEDIVRCVNGDISPEKKSELLSSIDEDRKQEVIDILVALEPVFKSLYSFKDMDALDTKRMEKVVEWFTGFSKRLQTNPKLASQDGAVISAMKNAVGRTIGKTTDAQNDLNTPRQEKKYEGVEYGDN